MGGGIACAEEKLWVTLASYPFFVALLHLADAHTDY
jgi:hypothetical protein